MKDKIIQIQVDSENGMTGLSESGKVYDYMPAVYKRFVNSLGNSSVAKNELGEWVIEKPGYWKLLIKSPNVKGGE